MEEKIKTEQEFKEALLHCTRYMTKQGSESVEMDIDKISIRLELKLR